MQLPEIAQAVAVSSTGNESPSPFSIKIDGHPDQFQPGFLLGSRKRRSGTRGLIVLSIALLTTSLVIAIVMGAIYVSQHIINISLIDYDANKALGIPVLEVLGYGYKITNESSNPITIHRVVFNDEAEAPLGEIVNWRLLISEERSYPVKLSIGESLFAVRWPANSSNMYEKRIIFIDVYTDRGVVRFKPLSNF